MSSSTPRWPQPQHLLPVGAADLSTLQAQIHWTLRVTVALCFIGHGVWGVITKAAWLPFFVPFGISEDWAWKLMPVIGTFDITMGLLILHRPRRLILAWMVGWATLTAALRPIASMGLWEFWERGGNYLPPVAFLVLGGTFAWRTRDGWLGPMREPSLTPERVDLIHWVLRIAVALLLIGHAGFGVFMQKPMLIDHFSAIGVPATSSFLGLFGTLELVLAGAVLYRPTVPLLAYVLVWKVLSELLYPISGSLIDTFEFIERWGDYGAPIALIQIQLWRRAAGLREATPLLDGWPAVLRRDLLLIVGGAILVTFAAMAFDLDQSIAAATFDAETGTFGKAADTIILVSDNLAALSFVIAVGMLLFLAVPTLRRRHPDLSRLAAIFSVTLLIAVLGGVHNLKQETSRPRPRQVTQFEGKYEFVPPFSSNPRCKRCVSFPSSAAGFGFLVVAPFFVWRRKRSRLARSFLVGGLVWGSMIGWGKITTGSHWFTDILWSAALVLAVMSVLAAVSVRWSDSGPSS